MLCAWPPPPPRSRPRSRRHLRPRAAVRHVHAARPAPGAVGRRRRRRGGVPRRLRGGQGRVERHGVDRRRADGLDGHDRGTTARPRPRRRRGDATRRPPAARRSPRRPPGRTRATAPTGSNVLTESGIVRSDITASFGSSTNVAEGVPLTIELTVTDTRRRLRAARRRRRVPVALRPRRQLLDVLGARRELPARRAGDRRRRTGDVHQHLPGVLLGPLAAHPLRGVPGPGRDRRRRQQAGDVAAGAARGHLRRRSTPPRATSRASATSARSRWSATTCSATTRPPTSWRR